MPYSEKIEGDFRALARDVFNQIMFYCQTPEEINSFCRLLNALLEKDINPEDRESIENCVEFTNTKSFYENSSIKLQIANVLKLISYEGFELYATDGIIDFENFPIKAFTSNKTTREESLAEAKTEFIAVLKNEFQNQLTRIYNLSQDEKLEKINDNNQDKKQTQINQEDMKNKQPPAPNSEAHVESELETLRRLEREFQTESLTPTMFDLIRAQILTRTLNLTPAQYESRQTIHEETVSPQIETSTVAENAQNTVQNATANPAIPAEIGNQTRNRNLTRGRQQFFAERTSQHPFDSENNEEVRHIVPTNS